MKQAKTLSIIGARPQFIKYAPLSKILRQHFTEVLVHTGQHYDYLMDKIFFDELGIPSPDYNLHVGSGTHGLQTAEMLQKIEAVLLKERPQIVLVYGDTNSTLAGALAAVKIRQKVGHIEAGLRSYDHNMPEEINRVMTDHCSDILFCPTRTSLNNLAKENINRGVYFTGDVMVDSLRQGMKLAKNSNVLRKHGLLPKQYLLATIHRQCNTDIKENLECILKAFSQINRVIILPVHPRTRKTIETMRSSSIIGSNLILTDPMGYFDFIKLLYEADKVLTDSGGVQKEAYILNIPCITLRDTSEWVETIEDGWNVLAGNYSKKIVQLAEGFNPSGKQSNIFGTGACENITKIIESETI